ncbi:MAG: transglutaminase family protein [Leptolyngbyaceae bacterium]|nr:transglutaminase family protein [Leptolyngbyaceae bacterium]
MANSASVASPSVLQSRTIQPVGAYHLTGLAVDGDKLLCMDSSRGYLLEVDPYTDNAIIRNSYQAENWIGAAGLALSGDTVWFTKDHEVFWCDRTTLKPTLFTHLPYPVDGVTVGEEVVYIACQRSGYIYIYERKTAERITRFPLPGIGQANLTLANDALWVCDRAEQTVYCMDRATGVIRFSALTPFLNPTAIAFYPDPSGQGELLYVAYANEEPYIRDDPNADSPYQLTFRDRTFIHPLHIYNNPDQHYTLSNGYLIELSYVEEIAPLEEITINEESQPLKDLNLQKIEWRIALPTDTIRQRVRHIEPIGRPFTEEIQDGQRVAVYKLDSITSNRSGLLGWRAVLEMYSLKYYLSPADVEDSPPLSEEFQQRYLVDDDDLAMDTPTIQTAARESSGTETNVLRKMLKIRNYVYDRLSYGIQPHIDTPDVALERGVASCGEYVGVLLGLARLNGIACRTIGRYKCPQKPEYRNLILEPDFNHVWIEFYVPGFGWVPMESNVDDIIDNGPYPTRFFMGLAWYHTEIGKGIPFERVKADGVPDHISVGDLSINHIRFKVLEELSPYNMA